ncbi:hypothetical protein, partial [Planomonospora parontospora]|uniref:hypothetical protein n=1 Tax=Planomonospora parontospora TaxID=58119 RepID=UPI001E515F4B
MPLRLAYLTAATVFAFLRLLPGSDRDKEIEILVLRHQLAVLQCQRALRELMSPSSLAPDSSGC